MRLTVGKGAGVLGGLLTVAGTVLPWAISSGGSLSSPVPVAGVSVGWGGWTVLGFGVLGIVLSALDRPVAAALVLELGILALFLTIMGAFSLPALARTAGAASATTTPGYGLYLALAGSAVLLAGGAVRLREQGRARTGVGGTGAEPPGGPLPLPPPPRPPDP